MPPCSMMWQRCKPRLSRCRASWAAPWPPLTGFNRRLRLWRGKWWMRYTPGFVFLTLGFVYAVCCLLLAVHRPDDRAIAYLPTADHVYASMSATRSTNSISHEHLWDGEALLLSVTFSPSEGGCRCAVLTAESSHDCCALAIVSSPLPWVIVWWRSELHLCLHMYAALFWCSGCHACC